MDYVHRIFSICCDHHIMIVATHFHHFLLCPSMAIPDVLQLTTATPFFPSRLLAANHPVIHIFPFLPLKATTFLHWFSPGLSPPAPVLLASATVHCLRLVSIIFTIVYLLIPGDYSPISHIIHSSPSPTNRRPQCYKQQIFLNNWFSQAGTPSVLSLNM